MFIHTHAELCALLYCPVGYVFLTNIHAIFLACLLLLFPLLTSLATAPALFRAPVF